MPRTPRATDQADGEGPGPRFLTLADVAEVLATSVAQVRALVQSGELRYIQIGGRQQYRIEAVELEKYIQRLYAESDAKARQEGTGTDEDADRPS
jgi:excisionase family DNA binding protein